MKKAGKAGLLCLLLISLLGACSPKNRIEETESTESSQESQAILETEETEPSETEPPFEYRERKEDSLFREEELRKGGNLAEQYYKEKGKQLICVSFDEEESPFLNVYSEFTPQYGEGNVLVLDVQLKGEEGPHAIVLVRNGPEEEWIVKTEKP